MKETFLAGGIATLFVAITAILGHQVDAIHNVTLFFVLIIWLRTENNKKDKYNG